MDTWKKRNDDDISYYLCITIYVIVLTSALMCFIFVIKNMGTGKMGVAGILTVSSAKRGIIIFDHRCSTCGS